jgi:hypothetical protein
MKSNETNTQPGHPLGKFASLNVAHLRTLDAVFHHPSSHNLKWSDILGLIGDIGETHEKANGEFVLHVAGNRHIMRRPHTKDMTASEISELRHFLAQAGWSPEAEAEPITDTQAGHEQS